jgi:chitinase
LVRAIFSDVIAATSSLVGVCLFLLTVVLWYKKYYGKGSKNTPRIESFLQNQGTSHPKRYTYPEVRRMTNSLAHKLGQGGFGAVYRGKLPDGREIAVKMLKDTQGDGEEFMNEVASISRTSHVNVVTLLGFCLQGSKRALIYEYMTNGSLERYTFGNSSAQDPNALSWERLFDIVLGIARGLEYLHRGCNTRIIHFDIKPQNILLDGDFCPKIADFGLAKLCKQKDSKISIGGARGTVGYIAPELFSRQYGAVSSKSDVYGYGMVVLEMVGARKQVSVSTDSSTKYFPQWIYDNLDEFCGTAGEIISDDATVLVRKMTLVGLWCIQLTPTDRPSMSEVLDMLESNSDDLQLPPKAG